MDDIRRLAQSKNDVEAHIFETRDLLEYNDEIKAVLAEEQTDKIRAALSEAEEWLWEDHEYGEYVVSIIRDTRARTKQNVYVDFSRAWSAT